MSQPVVILNIDGASKFYSVDLDARTFRSFEDETKIYTESDLGRSLEEILKNDKVLFE
jgi:hypothetical protein